MVNDWALAIVEVFVDLIGRLYFIDFGGTPLAWVLITFAVISIVIRYLFGKG